MTLTLMFGISYAVVSLDIAAVRENWSNRRCEPAVILTGWLYKPANTSTDASEFAFDNFSFCMNRIVDSVLNKAFAPIFGMFKQSLSATDQIQSSTNALKGAAKKMTNSSMGLFQSMFNQFDWITMAIQRSMIRFSAAMGRISGIFTATLFAGLSGIVALDNAKKFIIKVCIIILSVLTAIFILLIFVLFPFVPVILTTIGVLTAAGAGAAVGGMADTFCVPPGTLVKVEHGWRPVEQLSPGDNLDDSTIIEGMLQADGSRSQFVRIHDVIVSAGHLVWDINTQQWCAAEDHTNAILLSTTFPIVYCLNTTSHTWRIRSPYNSEELLLRDWEELPADKGAVQEWETWINSILQAPSFSLAEEPVRGLLGPEVLVRTRTRGPQKIKYLQLGEEIRTLYDKTSAWTRIRAIVHDISENTPIEGANQGCWIYHESLNKWSHPSPALEQKESKEGYHIITEAGTFVAESIGLLRDFTEVGLHELDQFRPSILKKLNSS